MTGPARRAMRAGRGDQGTATLITVTGVAVLLTLLTAAVAWADLVATGTRAAAAADQAALAAAAAAVFGPDEACARARMIASANGARVVRCRVGDPLTGPPDADVVVGAPAAGALRVIAPVLGMDPPVVRARALAGPARAG